MKSNLHPKEAQKLQLQMAVEFKIICEKYQIPYFIIAGTLLGAVRHGGFIPWDDDFDIGMLRNNYNKFIKLSKTEIGNKYKIQTWNTDDGYGFNFLKIRMIGTQYIEESSRFANAMDGIYIDVFPFDNVPDNKFDGIIQSIKLYLVKRLILLKLKYTPWVGSALFVKYIYLILLQFINLFFSAEDLKNYFDNVSQMYNNKITKKIVAIGGSYGYKRETFNREVINELILINFENIEFSAPKKYDEYLSNLYGDYMVPTIPSQRNNRHRIVKIDI